MVDLPNLDYKQLDRLIAHKQGPKRPLPNNPIITHHSVSVKTAATVISDEGDTVVRQTRQVQKHLSEEEVAQIIRAYQSGTSTNELARQYGCHRHTICDHLRKHGIEVTRNKIRSAEAVCQVIALYEQGNMIEDIANQYDVSQATINRLLHGNGVKVRSRWDYKSL